MQTILITGWLGYIWSHTAVLFLEAGYQVIIIDNLSNSEITVLDRITDITWKQPIFYQGDIKNKHVLEDVFDQHHIDGVIHFAALKAVGESCAYPFLYYHNNIVGTIHLLECMQKYAIHRIVFSSSATVYDASKSRAPFDEEAPLGTTNPYGTTKLVMEYLLKDLATHQNLQAICLRYFNPIGAHPSGKIGENPRGIPNNLLPYIFKVAKGELPEVHVFGNDYPTPDGTGIRDYLHVMDLAQAHVIAYEKTLEKWYEVINL